MFEEVKAFIKQATGIPPVKETVNTIITEEFEISIRAESFEQFEKRSLSMLTHPPKEE